MKLKTVYSSKGEMADTPAAIDRKNHILVINPKKWFKLTDFQRKFIKQHEYGHLVLNTDSELEADTYAFNQLAGTEFRSLKQCIECLEEILNEDFLGHKVRIDHMYNLAIEWDKKHSSHLNKGAGAAQAAQDDAKTNDNLVWGTAMIKQLEATFNSLQNILNSILITGVLIVAMIFILKNTD